MSENLLEIRNLVVHYETDDEVVEAVNNLSLTIARGETLGLVGETGAGKTTVALAVMGLLPNPPANIIQGEILLNGENLLEKKEREMRTIRGDRISMIFQDPMTALNPVMPVGKQIAEMVRLHSDVSRRQATQRAEEMLKMVGILPERMNDYPHQFSGGMKQRVVVAIALACNPELLIADEPTTALDVTIQAQVLEMMRELQKESNTSLLLITHDFGVVADICKKCAVIYAGEIVEYGTVEHIFDETAHPYTIGLFESLPQLGKKAERLKPIPGMMSDPTNLPTCCSFCERCKYADEQCRAEDPTIREISEGHWIKCFHPQKGVITDE